MAQTARIDPGKTKQEYRENITTESNTEKINNEQLNYLLEACILNYTLHQMCCVQSTMVGLQL